MTWTLCPFCKNGSKGIVPVMCTAEEFLWLNETAKKHNTDIDSVFVQLVRNAVQKEFPEWKPYHPLDTRDLKLALVDGKMALVPEA